LNIPLDSLPFMDHALELEEILLWLKTDGFACVNVIKELECSELRAHVKKFIKQTWSEQNNNFFPWMSKNMKCFCYVVHID